MNRIYLVIIASTLLFSCEKAVDIQPANQQPVLVVDAQIENGQPPVIQLSNSINYFSKISPQILQGLFVHNAKVSITNGSQTHQLKEYTTSVGGGFSAFYYSTDSANLLTAITGQFGKTYNLSITVDGKQYSSTTTIPMPRKKVDSLWWRPAPLVEDTPRVVMMARVTDPIGYGDYIRYFTRVNRGQYLPGATSAYDDQLVDGKTYDIQVDQGINLNDPPGEKEYGFFRKGDTATVKFCNIDKATYDFWRTIEYSYQSIGNPFSSPATVIGNVSGALGAFCGYAVQYKTLIIPK